MTSGSAHNDRLREARDILAGITDGDIIEASRVAADALEDAHAAQHRDYGHGDADPNVAEDDRLAELEDEYGYTILLPRDDVAALMSAIAELEDRAIDTDTDETVATLSRIASTIDEQVSTQ